MLILTIKTDQALSELVLFDNQELKDKVTWEAHRILADTIHLKLAQLLERSRFKLQNIKGLVCFKGPGSFTGLRIGLSVANALAYGLNIPIVSGQGDNWQIDGINQILAGKNEKIVLPVYGGEANISKPKK